MGQSEVYEYLLKQEEPQALRKIAKELNINSNCIRKTLRVLIKHKEVHVKEVDHVAAREKYGLKRRVREYYIKKNKED